MFIIKYMYICPPIFEKIKKMVFIIFFDVWKIRGDIFWETAYYI